MKAYLIPLAMAGAGVWMISKNMGSTAPSTSTKVAISTPAVPVTRGKSWSLGDPPPPRKLRRVAQNATMPLASATPSGSLPEATYKFFQSKLIEKKHCLETRNCSYSEKGSKDYDTSVFSDMVTLLKDFDQWRGRNNCNSPRVGQLMRQFLSVDNAYVKIESLKVMSTQNVDARNLDSILAEVVDYYQPEVIPYGIRQLTRYDDPRARLRIDDALENALLTGAVYSGIEIATQIKPLINDSNRHRYTQILHKLEKIPMSEDVAEALRRSLD